jgi:hypothetical protein
VNNIDVFCEKGKKNFFFIMIRLSFYWKYWLGVYNIEQSRRILLAGKEIGLEINFHGDELNYTGSAEVKYFFFLIEIFFNL